ncbi:unnamed protein product [Strongylus vulgaris]|uniref:Aquaporin n=1 Tax=Strongylus vulgaris TaxID=40348 RepID=A0A3P7J7Q2_STRVU|nr:unnamed protein product [Strongylus vulgaris]
MRVWVASLVFYAFVFAVCEFLRYLILKILPKRLSTDLLLEFVGTLQICTPMFDVGTVLETYGLFGVFVEITVIELANCYYQRDAVANPCPIFVGTLQICTPMFDVGTVLETYGLFGVFVEITVIELANCYYQRDAVANPCPIVTSCYRRSKAIRRAVYVFLTQMLAAYLSFFLARTFWKLGIHPVHSELLAVEHCTADLTSHSSFLNSISIRASSAQLFEVYVSSLKCIFIHKIAVTTGCLVEGGATFIVCSEQYILAKVFDKYTNDYLEDTRLSNIVTCVFSGFLCAIGINYTGMYANPLVAWACTFNCEGLTHVGHLLVYWLSPLIGWFAAEAILGDDEEEELEKKKE